MAIATVPLPPSDGPIRVGRYNKVLPPAKAKAFADAICIARGLQATLEDGSPNPAVDQADTVIWDEILRIAKQHAADANRALHEAARPDPPDVEPEDL